MISFSNIAPFRADLGLIVQNFPPKAQVVLSLWQLGPSICFVYSQAQHHHKYIWSISATNSWQGLPKSKWPNYTANDKVEDETAPTLTRHFLGVYLLLQVWSVVKLGFYASWILISLQTLNNDSDYCTISINSTHHTSQTPLLCRKSVCVTGHQG